MTRSLRDYNYVLIGCVIVLTGFSLAMVYSATLNVPDTHGYFGRHLGNLGVATLAMLLFTILDYHALEAWAIPLFGLMVVALAVVLVLGKISSGAQSWLAFGFRNFQPSEAAKIIVMVALAALWSRFERATGTWRLFLGSLALVGVPTGLIFIQPDFGTAMVLGVMWLAMAWAAGSTLAQMTALFVAGIPSGFVGWSYVLAKYQKDRLLIFIDPLKYDPELKHGAWNILQSLRAISSGGATGRGWTHGVMAQANTLPVQYTDFIFAITAEELGFIGTALMLVFQGLLIWQAFSIAATARDTFGRLLAVGIGAIFLCHLLVNAGMNMSIMPITGIPLPFISYGGSFTLTSFVAVGLLQSVSLRHRRITF